MLEEGECETWENDIPADNRIAVVYPKNTGQDVREGGEESTDKDAEDPCSLGTV